MIVRRHALVLAALLAPLAAVPAHAQGGIPEPKTLVGISVPTIQIAAGARGEAKVTLRIEKTWHINANPPSLDYMIPTTVTIAGAGGVTASAPVYPTPHETKLAFEDTPLLTYDGEAVVRVPISVAAGATPGVHRLEGQLGFQACNDQVCLQPVSVPFAIEVTVLAGGAASAMPAQPAPGGEPARGPPQSAPSASDSAAAPAPGFSTTPPAGGFLTSPDPGAAAPNKPWWDVQSAYERGGLFWFLILFVGGLGLNMTPCVFPMLGVTLSIFGARSKEPLPKVLAHASVYVLGMAAMYSVLGVVAGVTGSLFGAALQNPLVNVGLGALLIGLSLSMFGLYEMQPPLWLMSKLGGANTTTIAGLFVSGLGVGIIAAPCVGPFVVAVLALIAKRQDVLFGFQTMFTVALGLGVPYLVLGTFSGLLRKLPQSGHWMVWVKKVFGVLLVGLGAFYLSITFAPDLRDWVLPVALAVGGLWLGFLDRTPGKPGFVRTRMAAGVLATIAAVVIVATRPAAGIAFTAYDPMAVTGDLPRSRPVLLDFSADWCIPCHELESQTFTDRRVVAAARGFDAYKVDLTRFNSPEVEAVRRQYRINGVPTLVFLDTHGREIPAARVEGFIKPDAFLERLRLAGQGGGQGLSTEAAID